MMASPHIHLRSFDERLSALRDALDRYEQWGLSDSDVEILCLQHGFHVDMGALGMHQQTGVRISLVMGDTVYQLVRLSTGILRPIGTGSYDGGVPDRPVLVSLPGDRWPWWHCPSCGLEVHCPLEHMNDGQCPDCNDPFLEGRLPSDLRISLELRDQAVALGKGKPHPLHPDDAGFRVECAFCRDERAVARREEGAARRGLDSLGQALDDEPVTDEEGRQAVARLGIDVEAWAAEIRQRVADAEKARLKSRGP